MTYSSPTPADRAAAERFVTEAFDNDPETCRQWLATHRPALVRGAAVAAMAKRQDAEFRAALAKSKRADKRIERIIETELPAVRAELREHVG